MHCSAAITDATFNLHHVLSTSTMTKVAGPWCVRCPTFTANSGLHVHFFAFQNSFGCRNTDVPVGSGNPYVAVTFAASFGGIAPAARSCCQ
jgi:hypothetical protein